MKSIKLNNTAHNLGQFFVAYIPTLIILSIITPKGDGYSLGSLVAAVLVGIFHCRGSNNVQGSWTHKIGWFAVAWISAAFVISILACIAGIVAGLFGIQGGSENFVIGCVICLWVLLGPVLGIYLACTRARAHRTPPPLPPLA